MHAIPCCMSSEPLDKLAKDLREIRPIGEATIVQPKFLGGDVPHVSDTPPPITLGTLTAQHTRYSLAHGAVEAEDRRLLH